MEQNQGSTIDYSTNRFLQKVYEDSRPKENILSCDEDQMDAYRNRVKSELEECLKLRTLDEKFGCQLSYKKESEFREFDTQIERYCVEGIEDMPFPVFVVKPEKPNGVQVLYCHGHDDLGVMGALLERHDKVRYHKNLPILLAKAGFTVVAPEFAGFGDCDYLNFPEGKKPKGGCVAHVAFLTVSGYSAAGLRTLQALKTLDFMDAMGMNSHVLGFGVSGGGMIIEYTGILDQRVQGMCVSCYASLFRNSILYKEHCVDNYVPGILEVGESHEILSVFSPRPLMTINGTWDRAFPVEGTNIAFPFLKKVYARTGGDYTDVIFEGKHEINADEVLAWFEKMKNQL